MPQGPQHAMTAADGAAAIAKAAGKLQDAKNFTKSVNKQAGVPDKSDAPKASPAATPAAKPAVKEPGIGDELGAKAKRPTISEARVSRPEESPTLAASAVE